jgi:hypothetical protein
MFLRCPCGADFMLAKHLLQPWVATGDLEAKLDDWFRDHELCGPKDVYPAKPRLVYESDPDYATPEMIAEWERRTGKSWSETLATSERYVSTTYGTTI